MNLEDLGFRRSLALSFGVVLLAMLGAAAYTWVHLTSISNANADAAARLVPQLARVAAIELNITRVSLQARHAMLSRTPEQLRATLDDIGAKRKAIDEAIAGFEANVRSDRGKELFADTKLAIANFWKEGEANLGMTVADRRDEAFEHLVTTLIPARERLLSAVIKQREYQEALLAGLVKSSQEEARTTKAVQAVVLTGSTGVLLLTGWALGAYVRRRLHTAAEAASRIATGDLGGRIETAGRDEFQPLMVKMEQMQASLRNLVGQVRAATDGISTASDEIATGNADLSGRTERAAGSLQQTASSIEQLTGAVRQSADSARQANQLAASAAQVATRGGEVVSQVVSTMQQINDSSRKIADIIGVIDGIAFQTNILALNAAVEAARAGEQGRGFAVVAGEVRTLAQRSAGAAREIKALIGTSVERVESGSRLVGDAGQTMNEIVQSVQRVSDIIGEITAAAGEQSQGIGGVNDSVNQLDQMTQQNASLVEQSAAAGESLREQARRLQALVASFRLQAG
jgi:methyl-accepting chemotaxis protein